MSWILRFNSYVLLHMSKDYYPFINPHNITKHAWTVPYGSHVTFTLGFESIVLKPIRSVFVTISTICVYWGELHHGKGGDTEPINYPMQRKLRKY
ncbi:hypothetical protein CEXT_88761 [Caerostris extrusa]|uniref:Uncharacterized protein n=1 Tax=Caerostris extrusa TaxID=172846 RepID=A0AAV4XAH3_CAEEX|nr:hypothetical protein CEXT_88761 [Caerostris extrusa]